MKRLNPGRKKHFFVSLRYMLRNTSTILHKVNNARKIGRAHV